MAVPIVALLLLAGALPAAAAADPPLRVGYTSETPFYFRVKKRPLGFAVDVITEAARRARIPIEWVWVPVAEDPLRWLDNKRIDLWPAGVSTTDRRLRFHYTQPWWGYEMLVLTKPQYELPTQLDGKRLAWTGPLEVALERMPRARLYPLPSFRQGIEQLCLGGVDGVLLDRLVLDRLLLERPFVCNDIRLGIIPVPSYGPGLSIVATPSVAQYAEALRAEITGMEWDASMARIAVRYPAITSASTGILAVISAAKQRQRWAYIGLAMLTVLLVVSGILIVRLWVDIRARQRAERALRQSNEDLQQFAYVASHDLREPLRNVATFSQLLLRSYGPEEEVRPERRKYLEVIGQGARRMEALISALLSYSRLTGEDGAGQQTLNLEAPLRLAIGNLAELIAETGTSVTHGSMPPVRVHPVQMMRVFQNLLENSIRYRRPDVPLKVAIAAERRKDHWLISLRDNGQGFEPEYAERIFGIFKRLHGTEVPGTGIGLAICRSIIDRHGGAIWAEGRPGDGASFYFTLPAAR